MNRRRNTAIIIFLGAVALNMIISRMFVYFMFTVNSNINQGVIDNLGLIFMAIELIIPIAAYIFLRNIIRRHKLLIFLVASIGFGIFVRTGAYIGFVFDKSAEFQQISEILVLLALGLIVGFSIFLWFDQSLEKDIKIAFSYIGFYYALFATGFYAFLINYIMGINSDFSSSSTYDLIFTYFSNFSFFLFVLAIVYIIYKDYSKEKSIEEINPLDMSTHWE